MREILCPRLNPNDDTCLLVDWLAPDGAAVRIGDELASVETSKAAHSIEAEHAGFLCHVAQRGEEVRVGQALARLFDSEDELRQYVGTLTANSPGGGDLVITLSARRRMEELGLRMEQLRGLGKKTIRASDVEALAQTQTPTLNGARRRGLTRVQQAVARTVTASHQAIPRAFVLQRVPAGLCLDWLRRRSKELALELGLAEFLIAALARLRSEYPFFFSVLTSPDMLELAPEADIGITLDAGQGLFVPVVRAADHRSLREIAEILTDYRFKAFRNAFEERDLTGGTLSVSLNVEPGTVFALPIIMPNQTSMITLSAVHEEFGLTDGRPVARPVVYVGLAYDHRIINGREASAFCGALARLMQTPETLE